MIVQVPHVSQNYRTKYYFDKTFINPQNTTHCIFLCSSLILEFLLSLSIPSLFKNSFCHPRNNKQHQYIIIFQIFYINILFQAPYQQPNNQIHHCHHQILLVEMKLAMLVVKVFSIQGTNVMVHSKVILEPTASRLVDIVK